MIILIAIPFHLSISSSKTSRKCPLVDHCLLQEVEQAPTIGNRPNRGFNTTVADRSTAESMDTINFEDILREDDTGLITMIEQETFDLSLATASTTTHLHLEEVDTIWADVTFADPDLGLCLPAAEAEGARVQLPVQPELEEDDLLKWIMDDTEIGDFGLHGEGEACTPAFFLQPLQEQEVKVEELKEVKKEELSEEEKYRRMREQNNKASQACRAKRKRKLEEQEGELAREQDRNTSLRRRLEEMEQEVGEMKRIVMEQMTKA